LRKTTNETGESLTLEKEAHVPERTCVLTRRKGTKDELIRLALSPDAEVAPDVRARAPGRGAWIGVSRAELDAANDKGKLKAALQRAFKANDVRVPSNLGERIEHALRKTALDRLGMEARAGNLLTGADRVEAAARAGKVRLLIHARDSSEDGRKRMDQAWRVGGGLPRGVIFPEPRTILSMALGRENVVHLALTDPAAAARVQHALGRWRAFIDPDRGPEGGNAALRTDSAEELTKE
jgi:predicted RNA-binding protein YlxR (DUF448 family)